MDAREPTTSRSPVVGPSKPRLLKVLGPGLISGAANDDPTAIATYSQAGARFGFVFCWLMPLVYPMMAITLRLMGGMSTSPYGQSQRRILDRPLLGLASHDRSGEVA